MKPWPPDPSAGPGGQRVSLPHRAPFVYPWPPPPFQQRWPWIGPDLQTVRDTLCRDPLPTERGQPWTVAIPSGSSFSSSSATSSATSCASGLLLLEDQPPLPEPRGWVLLVHGLGGSSDRPGIRRLAHALLAARFGVWRLNLRGAGAGRSLAPGTYAAACNADLLPVLAAARQRAAGLPLLGVGLSLGGTVLLNAVLAQADGLDGLACVSSPLDLAACSDRIDAPRNRLYQRVLLGGLIRQTLADRQAQLGPDALRSIRTIRQFDAALTAPRWGYRSVDHYYEQASPLLPLGRGVSLPPILLLHARDDPWVPAAAVLALQERSPAGVEFCLPPQGGHNGFHALADRTAAARQALAGRPSWADRAVVGWLARRSGG